MATAFSTKSRPNERGPPYAQFEQPGPGPARIFNNKDFRIGLSHAINREEILDIVFVGQGEPYQAAPLPGTPFYDEEMAKQYIEYDVELANEYLDKAGFAERDGEGFRLGPDGGRISFPMEIMNFKQERIDVLELVRNYWRDVGIDMQVQAGRAHAGSNASPEQFDGRVGLVG